MPRFTPFAALRYAADVDLDLATAPPYDVLSESDLDELNARSPINVTHVDVPRERDGDGRYDDAGATLRGWIDDGTIVRDGTPSFTIYRLAFRDAAGRDREIVGVLGGAAVEPYGEGGVLPHERITPKASTDRLDLTRATQTNMSPIWGLSLASGLTDLLRDPGEAVGAVTVDGVTHTVERIDDPGRVEAIAAAVGTEDILIADGHHRYGVAQQYRDEVREAGDAHSPAEDTLMFVNELVADQLSVEAIHRLYTDISFDDLVAAFAERFELTDAPAPSAATLAEMESRGAMCLVGPATTMWMTPRDGAFDGVRPLDGVWLEETLANVDHSVTYQHGVGLVADAVTTGRATAAVMIRPVSVAEIERTARKGVVMPPKSTFFTPKLLTGLVIRPLD
ncbi:MAG: DUF1015 domain-containing protein [Actinomycetota bacterium]